MSAEAQEASSRFVTQAEELIGALEHAERTILATIKRECEALRARRMLAAKSLHERLCETTKLYLSCARAARANIDLMDEALPGCRDYLDQRRAAFAPTLQIELAVLAAQRAAAEAAAAEKSFAGAGRLASPQNLPAEARPPGRSLPQSGPRDRRLAQTGSRPLPSSPDAPRQRTG